MISLKRGTGYSTSVAWIRTKATFSLTKFMRICFHGNHLIFCADSSELPLSGDACVSESISNAWFYVIYHCTITSYKL